MAQELLTTLENEVGEVALIPGMDAVFEISLDGEVVFPANKKADFLNYLYRAVDGQGNTVEFYLSRTRGKAAARAFFRKALQHHTHPHSITLDGHEPSHSALRVMGMNGEGASATKCCYAARGNESSTVTEVVE